MTTDSEHQKNHPNQGFAAILAICILPLLGVIAFLTEHGWLNAGWLYLLALCILGCVVVTIRAFPFRGGSPDRLLLRFYLAICLMLVFGAVNFYEPKIPLVGDAIAIGAIVLLAIVGYRPGLDSLKRKTYHDQDSSSS